MFQLAVEEFELLKSQSVISKPVGIPGIPRTAYIIIAKENKCLE